MNDLTHLLEKTQTIPLSVTTKPIENSSFIRFSYLSYQLDTVYGHVFEAKMNIKHAWIVLFHGLGAHTMTLGYLEFVKWWNDQGYDVIGMDCRHQGGLTHGYPDVDSRGLYLSGLERLETYYYTALYIDAYRLIDVAEHLKPKQPIYVTGGSQGGTLALFVAATHPSVKLVMADMPSNTDIQTLVHQSNGGFKVFRDLHIPIPSWMNPNIDILSYAPYINIPVLLASGSDDTICPIQTAENLFLHLKTDKMFYRYDHFGHGGYDELHFPKKLEFIRTFETKGSR